jgi:protein O-GlcNAc transferase
MLLQLLRERWRRLREGRGSASGADAQALYREGVALEKERRFDAAEQRYRRAVELDPGFAKAHNNLGVLLEFRGRDAEAADCYRHAAVDDPALPQPRVNFGNLQRKRGDLDAAGESYRIALALDPANVEAQDNLGNVLLERGEHAAARAAHLRAAELAPESEIVASNLLNCDNYSAILSPQEKFEAHKAWGRKFAEPLAARRQPWASTPEPGRRLRIGYVSPDFRAHAMSYFIQPLLELADPVGFELYCYNNCHQPDAVTARLRALVPHWRDIAAASDDDVARLVRRDGIDLLVDLAGHTAGGRLLVFAEKPAPVQLTFMGYVNTTGVTAIDYRITDAVADPAEAGDARYTERQLRLPGSLFGYRPPDDASEVGPLPALANGFPAFGSFNNFAKITTAVIDTWAQLLLKLPQSRLVMLGVPAGATQRRVRASFAGHGVDPARLELQARSGFADYLQTHNRVDIALDPFPFNGGVTTCHALWMGVPTVTLEGEVFAARTGTSLLRAIGLPELVASGVDDYVEVAANLAADLPRLAALRAGLRERMRNSPVGDLPRFVADLERLYRGVWLEWCAAQNAKTAR